MKNSNHILIPSPAGSLEVTYQIPDNSKQTMIICHPHPLYGGTMNNKVVTTIARACDATTRGWVLFNFRGVGKSTGQHDNGVGEQQDLLTIIEWLKQEHPNQTLELAGFSFGSAIAAALSNQGFGRQLITIAPPVMRWDFDKQTNINCPWLVIQGDEDEVIDSREVFDWFDQHYPQATMIKFAGVTHFFHGQLIKLKETLIDYLSKQ